MVATVSAESIMYHVAAFAFNLSITMLGRFIYGFQGIVDLDEVKDAMPSWVSCVTPRLDDDGLLHGYNLYEHLCDAEDDLSSAISMGSEPYDIIMV